MSAQIIFCWTRLMRYLFLQPLHFAFPSFFVEKVHWNKTLQLFRWLILTQLLFSDCDWSSPPYNLLAGCFSVLWHSPHQSLLFLLVNLRQTAGQMVIFCLYLLRRVTAQLPFHLPSVACFFLLPLNETCSCKAGICVGHSVRTPTTCSWLSTTRSSQELFSSWRSLH